MKLKHCILPALGLACIFILLRLGSIPQEQSYHDFADKRVIMNLPNFWNVVTNLPLAWIGILGLQVVKETSNSKKGLMYVTLFLSFLLLTAGSSYYHLWPSNSSLVYDRIPISMIIVSFFSWLIYDRISTSVGFLSFIVLNIVGVLSVVYWIFTEQTGHGDLRWYALIQFFPVLAIPLILLLYKSSFNHGKDIIPILLLFGLAKLSESLDREIYALSSNIISGHSIKHLLMASAGYEMVVLMRRRKKFKPPDLNNCK